MAQREWFAWMLLAVSGAMLVDRGDWRGWLLSLLAATVVVAIRFREERA